MAIFAGPDAYVSPSLYATKAQTGKVVPTWNYVVVHAYGELVVHDDPASVEAIVRRLTEHHEASRPEPWSVDDAPTAWTEAKLRGIVGIELHVTRIEGKAKLSQNQPDANIAGVIDGLSRGSPGQRALARQMATRAARRGDRPPDR